MQGVEQPVTPHSVNPFDLQVPERLLYPAFASLRHLRDRPEPRRYVPGPQPEGTARVAVSDDYYLGAVWEDYGPQTIAGPEEVFDIPVEQRDRWQAARGAHAAMQEEIEALMAARREDRRRHAEPAQRGPYIPQP